MFVKVDVKTNSRRDASLIFIAMFCANVAIGAVLLIGAVRLVKWA